MELIAPPDISFESAIALTETFISKIETIEEKDQEKIVTALAKSENGSRGFFVTYLTDNNPQVDKPSTAIIKGLKTSPEIVSELLVKNVAMSTAMKITHHRKNSREMTQKSERVTQRSQKIIHLLQLPEIEQKITEMQQTIINNEGSYQKFLDRWGYDNEQKQAIYQALNNIN